MSSVGEVKTKLINLIDTGGSIADIRARIVTLLGDLEEDAAADKVSFKLQMQAQTLREETVRVDAATSKLMADRAENDARKSRAEAKKAQADTERAKADADRRIAAANAMKAEADAAKAKVGVPA